MKQKTIVAIAGAALSGMVMALVYAGCRLEVIDLPDPVYIVEPYITYQPESTSYTAGTSANSVAPLTVVIKDWTAQDGALSYQWYTFTTPYNYLKGNVTKLGNEETVTPIRDDPTDPENQLTTITITYDPGADISSTAANARHYFYVAVKNFNPAATNKQIAVVNSEVAVISFLEPGAPGIPIITRQPAANSQARFGASVSPLSVRATVKAEDWKPDSELFYQWYQVTLDENGDYKDDDNDGIPDGTALEGETAAEFTPPASRLGNAYFYVKVTHTIGEKSTSEYSIPATLNVLRGLRAGTPVITVQPKAALYFGDDAANDLVIEAQSPDFGALTFQWYVNANPTVSGGTLVETQTNFQTVDLEEGKRRSTYTPTVSGNRFYYVVVTNTNLNVEGAVTATANTRAVNVRRQSVAAPPAYGSGQPSAANAKIEFPAIGNLDRYNYVRGYGGMEVAWANFPETFPEDTELQYDPDKLGFNILRIMLPVTDTNIDKAMDYIVNETKRRPHYYDNVKIVNKHGGYVAAAPWSPPKEWKSNNSINGGGYLRHEYYKQYAAYLRDFARHMNNRGAPIYCISIQNEPNYTAGYDGCEWTPAEMRDFFKTAGRFTEGVRGWGGGKQIPRVLTMNGESANNPDINGAAIADPAAYANIDIFARHVYGNRTDNMWVMYPDVQQRDGKEVWMTEHNINSANAAGYYNDSKWDYIWKFLNDVDLVMRRNNENAFVWWAGKRFYSMVGDGQYGTPPGGALPRGWGLSHYSKYTVDMTRIGFTMEGATAGGAQAISIDGTDTVVNGATGDMDNVSARVTAYISQDGNELSLVMWTPTLTSGSGGYNLGTIEINMPEGFAIVSATAIRSRKLDENTNVYQEPYEVLVSNDRTKGYVTLNNSQIISVKFTIQVKE